MAGLRAAFDRAMKHGRMIGPTPVEWLARAAPAVRGAIAAGDNAQDVVGVLFMNRALVWGDCWPVARCPTGTDAGFAMAVLFAWWFDHARDLLELAGFVAPEDAGHPAGFIRFGRWWRDVGNPARSPHGGAGNPRVEFVRGLHAAAWTLAAGGKMAPEDRYLGALSQALRQLRLGVRPEELRAEAAAIDYAGAPPLSATLRRADGSVDWGVRQIRDHLGGRVAEVGQNPAFQNAEGQGNEAGGGESFGVEALSREPDPSGVEELRTNEARALSELSRNAANLARVSSSIRRAREAAKARGTSSVAALEYVAADLIGGKATRASVAAKHGVSAKALRCAEPWARAALEAARKSPAA